MYTVHLSIYMLCCGFWWSRLTAFFFEPVFSFEKSRRCDDNQQITVSHFGEHKRLHLESTKQNYYIISFMSNNKSNLHSTSKGIDVIDIWWRPVQVDASVGKTRASRFRIPFCDYCKVSDYCLLILLLGHRECLLHCECLLKKCEVCGGFHDSRHFSCVTWIYHL